MLEPPKFLREGDFFPRLIEPDCFQALGIVWELAILEPGAVLAVLVGLVDVGMGLCHAGLERCFDEIQLRTGQRPLKPIEALNDLSGPDNFFEHLTSPSHRWRE